MMTMLVDTVGSIVEHLFSLFASELNVAIFISLKSEFLASCYLVVKFFCQLEVLVEFLTFLKSDKKVTAATNVKFIYNS